MGGGSSERRRRARRARAAEASTNNGGSERKPNTTSAAELRSDSSARHAGRGAGCTCRWGGLRERWGPGGQGPGDRGGPRGRGTASGRTRWSGRSVGARSGRKWPGAGRGLATDCRGLGVEGRGLRSGGAGRLGAGQCGSGISEPRMGDTDPSGKCRVGALEGRLRIPTPPPRPPLRDSRFPVLASVLSPDLWVSSAGVTFSSAAPC